MANKNPKKANLLDHHSIKHILDESVSEVLNNQTLDPLVKSINQLIIFIDCDFFFFGDVDCYESRVRWRCENEQCEVVAWNDYYCYCFGCSILQKEVPWESRLFDRLHRIISLLFLLFYVVKFSEFLLDSVWLISQWWKWKRLSVCFVIWDLRFFRYWRCYGIL